MKKSLLFTSLQRIFGFFTLLFLFLSVNIQAQTEIEIGLAGNCGYTPVNFVNAFSYPDKYMLDWNQVYYSASLKGFLTSDKKIHFGAEIGWHRLYYVFYRVPNGDFYRYMERNIQTISLEALARYFPIPNLFILSGVGIHIFTNGTGVGVTIPLECGYSIRLGDQWKIPVTLRWSPIFCDGLPMPVSGGVGLSYTIK